MLRRHLFLHLFALLLGLLFAPLSRAENPSAEKKTDAKKAPGKFMRIRKDDKGEPAALETATVRYVPATGKDGVIVDLVSVVHIGDRAYYRYLNKKFEEYDAVLYELVAEPGTRIPKGGKRDGDNPLGMVTQIMKLVLELEMQTEQIDYTPKHFIHADLSPQQMAEKIKARGDNGLTLALSIAADMIRQQNLQDLKKKQPAKENEEANDEEPDLGQLLLDPHRAAKLKRMMAQQFIQTDAPEGGFGKTVSTILIADRNQAALKVLQKEMVKGKKKIAIFYGAAHMPDFEKRLRDDFDLKRDREQWLTAWDLRLRSRGLGDLLQKLLE